MTILKGLIDLFCFLSASFHVFSKQSKRKFKRTKDELTSFSIFLFYFFFNLRAFRLQSIKSEVKLINRINMC